jgi:hypothetical protein
LCKYAHQGRARAASRSDVAVARDCFTWWQKTQPPRLIPGGTMTEQQIFEQILLNMGDKAPYLLAFFIFVRWMWPDIKSVLLEYLQFRAEHEQSDPVATGLAGVQMTLSGLSTSLQQYIDEARRAQSENAGMVRTVVGLVQQVQSERLTQLKLSAEQPPVSPTGAGSGETVDDQAARAVQA